jgi:mono/diheme cytochrome c family protein
MDEQIQAASDPGGEGDGDGSRTLQAWLAGIAIGCLVLAAMIVSYEIGKNNADGPTVASVTGPSSRQSTTEKPSGPGQTLFSSNCGTCHTLAAAGTAGAAGPNLDDLKPDAAMVAAAIQNGGAGSGAMPADLLSGTQAEQVAAFVAESVQSEK